MLLCLYCGTGTINYEMYVVREATKPPGTYKRWRELGYCCDKCYDICRPVSIDLWKQAAVMVPPNATAKGSETA